jgi:hypothetical protein
MLADSCRTLRRGQQRLYVHRGVEGDPKPETTTPSEIPMAEDEMGRLEQLVKDYERGDIFKIDWLDRIAFRQIERVHAVSWRQKDCKNSSSRARPANRITCICTSTFRGSTFPSCSQNTRATYRSPRLRCPIHHKRTSILLRFRPTF